MHEYHCPFCNNPPDEHWAHLEAIISELHAEIADDDLPDGAYWALGEELGGGLV